MSKEILEWDAVLADGTRIPITVESRADNDCTFFVAWVRQYPVEGDEDTAVLAAHGAVTKLLRALHDVRDLVPRGNPSRAELEAALLRRNATNAEQFRELDNLQTLVQALIDALPRCDGDGAGAFPAVSCQHPATRSWARGSCRYCDEHAPKGAPDYPRAAPLRAIVATLNPTPKETP